MERVGNFLRKYIPEVQPAIEHAAGVRLGEVSARPYADDCVQDTGKAGYSLALHQLLRPELMMAKGSTIYYNTSISTLIVPGGTLWNMTAHELGHIAHRKLVGRNELESPEDLREEVANYFAKKALDRLGKPVVGKVRKGARDFQRRLLCRGTPETLEKIVRYIRREEAHVFYKV